MGSRLADSWGVVCTDQFKHGDIGKLVSGSDMQTVSAWQGLKVIFSIGQDTFGLN
jgi:hypothetical protein